MKKWMNLCNFSTSKSFSACFITATLTDWVSCCRWLHWPELIRIGWVTLYCCNGGCIISGTTLHCIQVHGRVAQHRQRGWMARVLSGCCNLWQCLTTSWPGLAWPGPVPVATIAKIRTNRNMTIITSFSNVECNAMINHSKQSKVYKCFLLVFNLLEFDSGGGHWHCVDIWFITGG